MNNRYKLERAIPKIKLVIKTLITPAFNSLMKKFQTAATSTYKLHPNNWALQYMVERFVKKSNFTGKNINRLFYTIIILHQRFNDKLSGL